MPSPVLIFPQTALRPSTLGVLAPWWAPVIYLEPPVLDPPPTGPLHQAGLVQALRPQQEGQPASQEAKQMARLLRQWEEWTRAQEGSADLAAIRSGMEPPPPPETFRDLAREIKGYGQPKPDKAPIHPDMPPDFFLALAHIRDRESSEMEELLRQVELGGQRLGQVMGLEEADAEPADYSQTFYDRLPPLDYRLHEGHLLDRRLAAWAGLFARLGAPQGILATASLETVQALMERANRRLLLQTSELRSPAGAAMPFMDLASHPRPDSPLAQEAARLVLPDLTGLEAQALLDLAQSPEVAQVRATLAGILERLANEPWSASLAKDLQDQAREAAAQAAQASPPAPGPDRGLSIMVFPGLNRDQVLGLLENGSPADLPGPELWPDTWPAGSCPLLAVW